MHSCLLCQERMNATDYSILCLFTKLERLNQTKVSTSTTTICPIVGFLLYNMQYFRGSLRFGGKLNGVHVVSVAVKRTLLHLQPQLLHTVARKGRHHLEPSLLGDTTRRGVVRLYVGTYLIHAQHLEAIGHECSGRLRGIPFTPAHTATYTNSYVQPRLGIQLHMQHSYSCTHIQLHMHTVALVHRQCSVVHHLFFGYSIYSMNKQALQCRPSVVMCIATAAQQTKNITSTQGESDTPNRKTTHVHSRLSQSSAQPSQ